VYQGVGTVLLVSVPSSGVFFTTYEGLKYVLGASPAGQDGGGSKGMLPQAAVHALSSSIAQLANCAVVTPAEVLKQNAQMFAGPGGNDKRKGASSATVMVLQQLRQQPTKLWRGYSALVARDLPFTALQFPAFEWMKSVLLARREKEGRTTASREGGGGGVGVFERAWIAAVSAGVAGSAAAWVTTPFDVVKTRMMLEAGGKNGGGVKMNAFRVGKEVLHQEGVRGLFRGGLIRAALTILGNGLYMGCYEAAKLYLMEKEV